MRGFIAIELDDDTRRLLGNIQEDFRRQGVRGNYSHLDNLHLTVKFLGELDDHLYHGILNLIKKVAPHHKTFVLSVDSIGNFNKGNRSIIWAGLKRNKVLFDVYDEVETILEGIMPGKREKSYSPHITLIRETVVPHAFIESHNQLVKHGHTFTASGLSLMESTRVNGRLTYIRRAFEPFA